MPENTWTLNDSYPVSMAVTFAPPATEWTWWGPPIGVFLYPETATPPSGTHVRIMGGGFIGPNN